MADTANDEALARALQAEEEDLSPAPLEKPAVKERSWGDWWSDTSSQAAKLAQDAADASISAAFRAKEQASALAAQAEKLDIAGSVFGTISMVSVPDFGLSTPYTSPLGKNASSNASSSSRRANGLDAESGDAAAGSSQNKERELDLVYVTENIIAMAFPFDYSNSNSSSNGGKSNPSAQAQTQSGNDIHDVAAYLKRHHEGKYMIWNISEESYDYSVFGDQVLDYKFPGHPAPPLGLLFKICTSVESWLDADIDNVAVIHCLTGKGRTAALSSCLLAWLGEFGNPTEALSYIAERKSLAIDTLTIPSQRRYIQYFSNTLSGVKPASEPLLLRRIIINSIPAFGAANGQSGCCPYVQLFKGGKLICTASPPVAHTAAALGQQSAGAGGAGAQEQAGSQMALRWINASEGSVSFNVDCAVQGDILLRCRHADPSGARVSMFRAAFHTGYIPSGVMRLTKTQLDGCDASSRFDDDFFIDIIFAPIEHFSSTTAAAATGAGSSSTSTTTGSSSSSSAVNGAASSAAGAADKKAHPLLKNNNGIAVMGPPTDSGLIIDASSADRYEQALHRDTRFWDSVAEKQNKTKRRPSRKFARASQDKFSILDDHDQQQQQQQQQYSDLDVRRAGAKAGGAGSSTGSHMQASLTGKGGSSSSSSSGSKAAADAAAAAAAKKKGVSDMDLIQQLARAAEESDDDRDRAVGHGGSGSGGHASSLSVSSAGMEANDDEDQDDISRALSAQSASVSSSSSSSSGSSGAAVAVAAVAVQLTAELQALEDLERELGLSDLQLGGGGGSGSGSGSSGAATAGAAIASPQASRGTAAASELRSPADLSRLSSPGAGADVDVDADPLDELEQYLESLGASKGSV